MSSASRKTVLAMLSAVVIALASVRAHAQPPTTRPARVLHITADPNNLPFSNEKGEGFENKIAELIARDLNATIEYDWRAQRRGFFREAIRHGTSEIVMGVPTEIERVITTRPYFRSTYCFVHRKGAPFTLKNFDSPDLKKLKIGVPLMGGSSSTPPAVALANRGLTDQVVGFSVYQVDFREANPMSRIIRDVADGKIDVAIVWGPLAGYFAPRQKVRMEVVPIDVPPESSTPFAYDISIGVKRGNPALRNEIDQVLDRRKIEIAKILDEFGVPQVKGTDAPSEHDQAKRVTP
jgi:quinoprotein dehydrogenase-associated probable ABC transporter substrate-binding protein